MHILCYWKALLEIFEHLVRKQLLAQCSHILCAHYSHLHFCCDNID